MLLSSLFIFLRFSVIRSWLDMVVPPPPTPVILRFLFYYFDCLNVLSNEINTIKISTDDVPWIGRL